MNRWLRNAVLLLAGASLPGASGCFSVTAQAPYMATVKVLPEETPVEVRRTSQKWYVLFGLIPLTTADEPQRIIDEEELVEARVVIEDTLADILAGAAITFITVGIFSPTTVSVEGNRSQAPLASVP
jgi:hypothetical protein